MRCSRKAYYIYIYTPIYIILAHFISPCLSSARNIHSHLYIPFHARALSLMFFTGYYCIAKAARSCTCITTHAAMAVRSIVITSAQIAAERALVNLAWSSALFQRPLDLYSSLITRLYTCSIRYICCCVYQMPRRRARTLCHGTSIVSRNIRYLKNLR